MIDLIEIQEWLDKAIDKDRLAPSDIAFIQMINIDSLDRLDKESDIKITRHKDFVYLYAHTPTTFKTRTLAGLHRCLLHSEYFLNEDDREVQHARLLEWKDDLDIELEGDVFFKHVSRIRAFHNADNDISNLKYEWSVKRVHNIITSFVEGCINDDGELDYSLNDTVKEVNKSESEYLLSTLEYLSDNVSLETVYPLNGIIGKDFWRAKLLLEKIKKDLNHHAGGRPSKLEKELKETLESFCSEVDGLINDFLEGDIIKTWDLAGNLIDTPKYHEYHQDALNKFIKSVFENSWIDLETKLGLTPLIKFQSNFYKYLPKN